ncbi:MAG: hypothetical protein ACOVMK_03955, partial [Arenimonas sp.]
MSPINPASTRADILLRKLSEFMQEHVYPAEAEVAAWQNDPQTRWLPCPRIEALKALAREAGCDVRLLGDAL